MQLETKPKDNLKQALWQGAVAAGLLVVWLNWQWGLLLDVGVAGVVAAILTGTGLFRTNRPAYALSTLLAVAVTELARHR